MILQEKQYNVCSSLNILISLNTVKSKPCHWTHSSLAMQQKFGNSIYLLADGKGVSDFASIK